MKTELARQLGLEFPIFAFTHCRDVAAAVSKAGGFGVLGIAGHSPKHLDAELDWIENEVGDKPYGVDLLLPAKFAGSDEGGLGETEMDARLPAEHRQFLDEMMRRYGVPELPADARLRMTIEGTDFNNPDERVSKTFMVPLGEPGDGAARLDRAIRRAFFTSARDISQHSELRAIAGEAGIEFADLQVQLDGGRAHAMMVSDARRAAELGIRQSPTLVFDDGRQMLGGNVGSGVIAANLRALLSGRDGGRAAN